MVKPTIVRLRPRGRPAKVQSRKTPCKETLTEASDHLCSSRDLLINAGPGSDLVDPAIDQVENNQRRSPKMQQQLPSACSASTATVGRPTSARTTSTRSTSASPVVSSTSLKCREELGPSTPRLLETPTNYSSSETRMTATSTVY